MSLQVKVSSIAALLRSELRRLELKYQTNLKNNDAIQVWAHSDGRKVGCANNSVIDCMQVILAETDVELSLVLRDACLDESLCTVSLGDGHETREVALAMAEDWVEFEAGISAAGIFKYKDAVYLRVSVSTSSCPFHKYLYFIISLEDAEISSTQTFLRESRN